MRPPKVHAALLARVVAVSVLAGGALAWRLAGISAAEAIVGPGGLAAFALSVISRRRVAVALIYAVAEPDAADQSLDDEVSSGLEVNWPGPDELMAEVPEIVLRLAFAAAAGASLADLKAFGARHGANVEVLLTEAEEPGEDQP